MEQVLTEKSGAEPNPVDTTGLCLLSLDGGGVRGLSTLYILKGLMTALNHERQKSSLRPVKPFEVFDLIGGTSTGGFVYPSMLWLARLTRLDLSPLCLADLRWILMIALRLTAIL